MKMRDEASRVIKQTAANTNKLGDEARKAKREAQQLDRALGGIGRTAKLAIGALAGLGAGIGLTKAISSTIQFDKSLSRIVGLVGLSKEEVAGFREEILALGPAVLKGPNELAEALFFITSSGIDAKDSMAVLEAAAKAASAGLGEVTDVADALTSAVNAYGSEVLSASEATDVMVATVTEGKVEADQLAGSLGNVVTIAAQSGVTFNELGAAIASLTLVGLPAAEAVTSIRGILVGLQRENSEGAKILTQLGLSYAGLRKQIKEEGLLATLKTLRQALGENETALIKVFGRVEATNAVLGLTGANLSRVETVFRKLADATGATDRAMQAYLDTTAALVDEALVNLEVTLVRLADTLLPSINAILETVNHNWGLLVEAVVDAVLVFGTLKLLSIIKDMGGLAAAILKVRAAFIALTVAMARNPFGLLAVGAALLVGHLITMDDALEDLEESYGKTEERMKKVHALTLQLGDASAERQVELKKEREAVLAEAQAELLAARAKLEATKPRLRGRRVKVFEETEEISRAQEQVERLEEEIRQLQETLAAPPPARPKPDRPTSTPTPTVTGDPDAEKKAAEKIQDVIDKLKEEAAQVSLSKLEIEQRQAVISAGLDVESKSAQAIEIRNLVLQKHNAEIEKGVDEMRLEIEATEDMIDAVLGEADQRKTATAIIEAELDARKEGRELTEDEIEGIRAKIEDEKKLDRAERLKELQTELDLQKELATVVGLEADEREVATAIIEAQSKAKAEGNELTEEEIALIRQRIKLEQQNRDEVAKTDKALEERRQLARDLSDAFVQTTRDAFDATKSFNEVLADTVTRIKDIILELLIFKPLAIQLENELGTILGVPNRGPANTSSGQEAGGIFGPLNRIPDIFGGLFGGNHVFSERPGGEIGPGPFPGSGGFISPQDAEAIKNQAKELSLAFEDAKAAAVGAAGGLTNAGASAAGAGESMAGDLVGGVLETVGVKVAETVTTETLTGSLVELNAAAVAAAASLRALSTVSPGGAGGEGSSLFERVIGAGVSLFSGANTVTGGFGTSNPLESGFSGNPHFAEGGLVGRPSMRTRDLLGLTGGEVPIIAHEGEAVITAEDTKNLMRMGLLDKQGRLAFQAFRDGGLVSGDLSSRLPGRDFGKASPAGSREFDRGMAGGPISVAMTVHGATNADSFLQSKDQIALELVGAIERARQRKG